MLSSFQNLFLKRIQEWSIESRHSIKFNTDDHNQIYVEYGDIEVCCFENQVSFVGPNIARIFEIYDPELTLNILEEAVDNLDFYLSYPEERDIPTLKRPKLLFRWFVRLLGISIPWKIERDKIK